MLNPFDENSSMRIIELLNWVFQMVRSYSLYIHEMELLKAMDSVDESSVDESSAGGARLVFT